MPCSADSDNTLTGLGGNILWDPMGTKSSSLAQAREVLDAFGLACAIDPVLERVGVLDGHVPTKVHG